MAKRKKKVAKKVRVKDMPQVEIKTDAKLSPEAQEQIKEESARIRHAVQGIPDYGNKRKGVTILSSRQGKV